MTQGFARHGACGYCTALSPQAGVIAWVLAAAMLAGCGPSGQVKTYPVKGKVTFAGKPMVGGGSIGLIPLVSQPGQAPGGEIKEDGTYELTTYKPGDGSMVGEFRVIINQVTVREPKATEDGTKAAPGSIFTVSESDRIPAVYGDLQNSPLTIKVEAKPLNELDLELKRQ